MAKAVIAAATGAVIVPAVAGKVAVEAPGATVTTEGTVNRFEFEDKATARPPAGAPLVRVTVQVDIAALFRVVGAHDKLDRAGDADSVNVKVCAMPLCAAVTWAWTSVETWTAEAVNVAEALPAGTVTAGASVKLTLFTEIATTIPPVGADCDRVTVHVAAPGVAITAGEHVSPLSCTVVARVMVVLSERPLATAVMVATEEPVITPDVAEKVAVTKPAATVTVAGTVRKLEFDDRASANPPAGAGLVKATVHVEAPLDASVVGVQDKPDNRAGAARVRAKFCVAPL